jgi:hypothetical protein
MSIAKNTIRFSDVTTTPIKLKYSSSFASSSLASYGITQNKGVNVPVILSGSMLSPNLQHALKYKTIQQLYYKEYISSSLLGTGSAYDPSLQSTAASGSYDNDIRYFPTSSGDQIRFFAIPTRTFGEQIARKTFAWESLDSSTYKIIDDGNGNIVDAFNNYEHVGNILYAQGIVTVTNSNYLYALSDNHFAFSVSVIAPSPTPSITPNVTPSVTPSQTPPISVTPSQTPVQTPSQTPPISVTPSQTPVQTPSQTPPISVTPSLTPSQTPVQTPSQTPPISVTPSVTPSPSTPVYGYLGRATVDAANAIDACTTWTGTRYYYSLKSTVAAITAGDKIYDTYPGTPTNGNGNWIALKDPGTLNTYSMRINSIGNIQTSANACGPDPSVSITPSKTPSVTPSPSPIIYTITSSYSATDCGLACTKYYTDPTTTYYSLTNSFAINTYLYTTSACTTPVNAGYYSQGANCLTVNSSGKITATGVCPQYYFYDMTDCTTSTAKVGRSTTDLATLGTPVAIIGTYNCSLVHTDTGRHTYYEAYDYDLDTKTYVDNCSNAACVAPPAYNTFSLTYNNGDFESNACPGNPHNQGPNNYYTNNTSTIANGTVLYANTSLASGQEVADGYYYYGPSGNYYVVSGGNGILTDQTPC